ncbi:MAG TPA: hypothetical protein VL129_00205 [Pseudomonas sp.]|uniref:hypothetical protein n=1 Tax=Pseudomonas sp. TaxID=306 RepID=UPI002B82D81F|nr:hypothetical protein [Pseudomonas sp.]HTO17560.1 hypothetical protein [Pseudomonas sp.]
MQITAPSVSPIQTFNPSAAKTAHAPDATPEPSNSLADRVTLSEAGLRAAGAAQTHDHPVEMYQLPAWMAGSYIQAPNTLGANASWLTERYPQVATASSAERSEYSSLLQSTYQALLKDNGIHSVADHYQAMILDRESSESLRLQMRERVAANPRLLELMNRLGLGKALT